MATSENPELDIVSEKLWTEQRVKGLTDTISKYSNRGVFPKSMNRWAEELLRRIKERVDLED